MIKLEAGTCRLLVIFEMAPNGRTYVVNTGSLAIYTNNQFCPLPLLLAIAQTVDFSGNDATFSMIQRTRKSRQHKRLMYSVLGSHGDCGTVFLGYNTDSKEIDSLSRIFRPAIFLWRSISKASQKKKLERTETNSGGGARNCLGPTRTCPPTICTEPNP